jgi:hypothetical protein
MPKAAKGVTSMIARRGFRIRRRSFLLLSLCVVGWISALRAEEARWYKGNTHDHSFWSDGDEFPEMVADWYKSHGYDFLAISDHNCLAEGQRWMPIDHGKRHVPSKVLENCRRRFGADWLQLRGEADRREVKLKTLDEICAKLDKPGRFLLIPGEEITGKCGDHQVHVNAINLAEPIKPQKGDSVADTIRRDLDMVDRQARRLQRPILAHVNHLNWEHYDISAEDLANTPAQYFEVCNAGPWEYYYGDATHPGVEQLWDIANTIRITRMKTSPLYGIGSDDAHSYHEFSPQKANPGRAWIMVRAGKLAAESLLDAMNRGDYYVSTGVVLRDVAFDAKSRILRVAVRPEPGVHYTIEFIGTLEGVDPTGTPVADEKSDENDKRVSNRPGRRYSPEIGRVLESVEGDCATYRLTGLELYVRAVVRSDKTMSNPPSAGVQKETAWTQPVGWKN